MKQIFFEKVYKVVRQIPKEKVVTYGQVREVLGSRGLARAVGNALHQNPYPDVPCHQVVNQEGWAAEKFGKGGWRDQKERLLKENVSFKDQKRVDLDKYCARIEETFLQVSEPGV